MNSEIKKYSSWWNPLKTAAVNCFLSSLRKTVLSELNGKKRVLDLGCGEGFALNNTFEGTDCNVLGVDIRHEAIECARNLSPKARFVEADVLKFTPNEEFDMVVCSEVLEHVVRPRSMLRKAVCFADRAVFSTPDVWRYRLAGGKEKGANPYVDVHYNGWNKKRFHRMLSSFYPGVEVKRAGFFWLIARCRK